MDLDCMSKTALVSRFPDNTSSFLQVSPPGPHRLAADAPRSMTDTGTVGKE